MTGSNTEVDRLRGQVAYYEDRMTIASQQIEGLREEVERLRDAGLEAQANEARAVEAAEQLRAVLEEIKQTSEPGRGAYILASRGLLLCS